MKRYILLPLIVPVVFSLLTSCHNKKDQAESNEPEMESTGILITGEQYQTAGMQTGIIEEVPFEQLIRLNGYLKVPPQGMASVGTLIAGEITSSPLTIGAFVNKGDELFRIRSLEIVQMQQDYLDALARLTSLKADYERQKELSRQQIASQKTYLAAESEYLSMEARYQGLRSRMKMLHIPYPVPGEPFITEVGIRAPVSGYITRIEGSTGQFVEPQTMVMEMIDPAGIQLNLNVYEKDIVQIEKGMQVRFFSPDDREKIYSGKIVTIGKAIDPLTSTVTCFAAIDSDKISRFVNGMFVEAEIILSGRKARGVPSVALLQSEGERYLLVVENHDETGISLGKVKVKTGEEYRGYTELLEGWVSDSILVAGAYNLVLE